MDFTLKPRPRVPGLSIIIPCYNEADNLNRLLPRLQDMLQGLVSDWEVILVDDGSRDNTAEVFAFWSAQPGFQAIQLSRNFGKEAALTAGLEAARCETCLMMDADLQHSPDLIPAMLAQWQQGYDVVYAVREHRRDERLLKRLGAGWFYRLVNAGARFRVPADAGDFRLMDRAVVDALLDLPERNRFMKGLYAWVGFKSVEIAYVPEARAAGRTTFNPLRLLRLSLDGLTAFTTWPLHIASLMGFVLALLAFSYGGYLTLDYLLHGHKVPGWTTIVVGLMFFSAIQLIGLGVLGEYVSRIFEEVKGRPLYVVRHRAGRALRDSQS
ncbi:glycosyltransferase family 2 protein [Thiobacillus sedimenti]|uniref:Glycosyltransferase family 2 protein n=1 Tax=Thiobacillus sedimenti TaxID=3110231 RepID=A0ABZ1CM91_9PROT|nr:glycosyltransferase family 2 protein [Thiobacillus sp. SCUT-2]WRS40030.1 glycosyltransferase family 2 protein [Thiobacillus sp. SCUT-2]